MDAEFAIEVAERLAKLEEGQKSAERERHEMRGSVDSLATGLSDIRESISGMKEELARYRGFWGGALLVVSAVWAFLQLGWDWIAKHIKGD